MESPERPPDDPDGFRRRALAQAQRLDAIVQAMRELIETSKTVHHRTASKEELDHWMLMFRTINECAADYLESRARELRKIADAR